MRRVGNFSVTIGSRCLLRDDPRRHGGGERALAPDAWYYAEPMDAAAQGRDRIACWMDVRVLEADPAARLTRS